MIQNYITCSQCGQQVDLDAFQALYDPVVAQMHIQQLCFVCSYWLYRAQHPEPSTAVINGKLYKFNEPLTQPSLHKIRAKGIQCIIKVGTSEVYGTDNITLKGTVPARFSTLFPDQYRFITKEHYRRILLFDHTMCLSKGCFDRYHCWWYRADLAEPDEPWNIVPETYQIGGECCPSFINKYELNNGNS